MSENFLPVVIICGLLLAIAIRYIYILNNKEAFLDKLKKREKKLLKKLENRTA